jgi:hypothetical protein
MAVCDCIHTAEPHSRPFACALADTEGFAALLYLKLEKAALDAICEWT